MSTINPRSRQLAQVSRAATQPARITQAARPTTADPALNAWIGAMHEWRHVREGGGNPFEKVLTGRDLVAMGLATSSQITNPSTPARREQPGVVVHDGQGGSSVIGYEEFAATIRGTRLYHDLVRKIDDPTRFDELHARTKAALLEELAPIDGKIRGEIRRVEEIATSAKESLAQEVMTIRASVARASAGVRSVRAASASENRATAAQVTTVTARLDDFDGGGATVEETMTAIADRATGLEAQYTLKVTAGGAMAGFGLAATDSGDGNATSAFIIQADKFAIVSSSYAGGLTNSPDVTKIPFGIDSTGIYLTGNVRLDGSLVVSGTLDYSDLGGTKPPSNADNTGSAINATTTITGGGIVMSGGGVIRSGKTAYGSGTGFFLGHSGSTPVFDIGSTTNYLRWTGSTLDVLSTGTAKFNGAFSAGSWTTAIEVNSNLSAVVGGYFQSNSQFSTTSGTALRASGSNGACGIHASTAGGATPGYAGLFEATIAGTALEARSSSSNTALSVKGPMTIDNSTLTWNTRAIAAPTGATTTFLRNDGTWAAPAGTGVTSVTASSTSSGLSLSSSGGTTPAITLSGSPSMVLVGNVGTATSSGGGWNLQMGTGLAPTYEVNCSGNNAVLQTASDQTLKQDIEDETHGMGFVRLLRPRRFRFISDDEYLQHGFIAQEVAQIATPNGEKDALAFTNPNGKMGINHLSLIGPLVKAMQEIDARLAALEGA